MHGEQSGRPSLGSSVPTKVICYKICAPPLLEGAEPSPNHVAVRHALFFVEKCRESLRAGEARAGGHAVVVERREEMEPGRWISPAYAAPRAASSARLCVTGG